MCLASHAHISFLHSFRYICVYCSNHIFFFFFGKEHEVSSENKYKYISNHTIAVESANCGFFFQSTKDEEVTSKINETKIVDENMFGLRV